MEQKAGMMQREGSSSGAQGIQKKKKSKIRILFRISDM
jgi:hypothetical protein